MPCFAPSTLAAISWKPVLTVALAAPFAEIKAVHPLAEVPAVQ
jgi:hypothetical protein